MKPIIPLAFILALRFFGLFLVMPLLALYATTLEGGTPLLAGIAVGGYALMQMIFQYPFGSLSDRFGRKHLIAFGMLIFAIGSIICGISDDIYMLIIGRFLQGAGAVSSVITATIGDLTTEEKRSPAMAMMGGAIALSFIVALLVGPLVGGNFGVDKLFYASAILSIVAIIVLYTKVQNPPKMVAPTDQGSKLGLVFANRDLVKLNFAMFLHSFVMTATFIFIPLVLKNSFGWEMSDFYKIYLPAVFFGIIAMGLGSVFGEKYNKVKTVMLVGIVLLIASFLLLFVAFSETVFFVAVMFIFMGINSLEPLMQSSATKFAKASIRGAALGVFNAHQFLGVFVGGVLSGLLYGKFGAESLALFLAILSILWLIMTSLLTNPVKMKLLAIPADQLKKSSDQVESIEGVKDSYQVANDTNLYIRYDPQVTNEDDLKSKLI